MSTTETVPTVRPPRRRPAPSARDQELYVAYQTSGKTQAELAEQYDLTQCRVSQIIRRVEAWRSKLQPQPQERVPGGLSAREQQRLDRWLERERNEAILKNALRQFQQPQQVKTTKTGPRGEETTVRELPPNVQWLKVAQRANEQLFRREALEPVPVGEPDEQERQQIMFQELMKLRQAAQQGGRVSAHSDPRSFVLHLLRALQGERPQYGEEDQGLVELGDRLLWKRRQDEADRLENDRLRHEMGLPPLPGSAYAADDESPEPDSNSADSAAAGPLPDEQAAIKMEADANSSTCAAADESPQVVEENQLTDDSASEENSRKPAKWVDPGPAILQRIIDNPNTRAHVRESLRAHLAKRNQPQSRTKPPARGPASPSRPADNYAPPDGETDPAVRRRLHFERLELLKIARRRGLPVMFHFDPADGPLPPPHVQLDGAPCE